jgi:hypothetical protein
MASAGLDFTSTRHAEMGATALPGLLAGGGVAVPAVEHRDGTVLTSVLTHLH